MRRLLGLLVLLGTGLLAGGGCRGAPADADGGVLFDSERGVWGDQLDRAFLADGSIVTRPRQLGAVSIAAFWELADGGYESSAGFGTPDGRYFVPEVPDGPYLLQVGGVVVATQARALHLGTNTLGRPDVFRAQPGEGLSLTVDNLDPWGAHDELQFVSWNAGQGYFSTSRLTPTFAANAPSVGATRLADARVDFRGARVVEAERGDDLTIVQLSSTLSDAGIRHSVASRALPASTTLAIGALTPLSGTMRALPRQRFDATFLASRFVDLASAIGAGAKPFEVRLYVDAHPGPFGANTIAEGTPDLAVVDLPADAGDQHLAFDYGNPFDAAWTPFVIAGTLFDVPYSFTRADGGSTLSRSELGSVSVILSLAQAQAGPIEPLVTPLREITLDDANSAQPLDGVSLTPALSWRAPSVGTVSRVEIEAIELRVSPQGGTTSSSRGVLRVLGPSTRLRLPPGYLSADTTFLLRLTAFSLPPGWDPTIPLVDVGPPAGAATVLTATFRTRPN